MCVYVCGGGGGGATNQPNNQQIVGLPAVVSFIPHDADVTFDGVPYGEACRRLEEAGAAAVGLNCGKGPINVMHIMKSVRQACQVGEDVVRRRCC